MQANQPEVVDQQQKAKRVQEKIKLMMKYKKMQKLTSEKDLASEKPLSTFNDKASSKFDEVSIKNKKHNFAQNYRQQQTFQTFSTKRIKSIYENQDIAPSSSINLKEQGKKFILSNKERRGLEQTDVIKRVPSEEKMDKGEEHKESAKKLKRPSSVINKSTRATTSRTRKQKHLEPEDQKAMEQKIRQIIPGCFEHGIKLQKFADEKRIDLNKEHEILLSEQLNIIRLISNSKKYYVLKAENEEEQDTKLSLGVEREIIQMLKKKLEKEIVINKCSQITDQITKLIDARLSALNKTKLNNP